MFCNHCGAEAGESQQFCGSCGKHIGASAPERQPREKRRVRWWLVVSVLFGLAVLYSILSTYQSDTSAPAVAYCCQQGNQQNAANPQDTQPGTAQNGATEQQNSPQNSSNTTDASGPNNLSGAYLIGDRFSVGYWSYVCNDAYWTPFIGFDVYSMERANADFVVVNITAQNNDTSASTLPSFHLMDLEGRMYDESSAATLNKGFFSVLEQLNPGVSKRGNVAFDVPPGRQYYLIVSGGIESDKQASVTLPMSAPSSDEQPPSSSSP